MGCMGTELFKGSAIKGNEYEWYPYATTMYLWMPCGFYYIACTNVHPHICTNICIYMSLFVIQRNLCMLVFSTRYKLETTRKRESQLKDCFHQIGQWKFSWLLIWWRRSWPIVRSTTSEQVDLDCVSKVAELEVGGKPLSWVPRGLGFLPPGSCLELLLWLPRRMDSNLQAEANPFFSGLFVIMVLYTRTEKQTKTELDNFIQTRNLTVLYISETDLNMGFKLSHLLSPWA